MQATDSAMQSSADVNASNGRLSDQLLQLNESTLLQQRFDEWAAQSSEEPFSSNKQYLSFMQQERLGFELPTIDNVKAGLFHTEDQHVHWDCEIRRLLSSTVAVQAVAIEGIRKFKMFNSVTDKQLKKSLKKFLFQAELNDVYGMEIDALRLQSWNIGMVTLMNIFNQQQWRHKDLRIYQNLQPKYTAEELVKRRHFVQTFFKPTPEYAAFCCWHTEITAHLENRHLQKIKAGLAPQMTSKQPFLEMARHRHAAIAYFESYNKQKDYQATSSQEEREFKAQLLLDLKEQMRPYVIKDLAETYDAFDKYALENQPNSDRSIKLLMQIEAQTVQLAELGVKSELEKRQYQAILDYPLYSFYGECFEWVDTVDYRNTEMYDPKLQNMEKWQLFLLEVFFQTHPSHQTAEAKSAKYQRPAQGSNNNVDPELEEKKRSRISKLTALTYPATLRKLVTMDQDQKRDFEAYCKKDSKKRACTITFDGEEGPQIKTNKPTSKNKMYKKSLQKKKRAMRRKQLALEAIAIAEEKSDQTMKSQTGAELLDQSMTSECAVIQGHSSEEEEKESL